MRKYAGRSAGQHPAVRNAHRQHRTAEPRRDDRNGSAPRGCAFIDVRIGGLRLTIQHRPVHLVDRALRWAGGLTALGLGVISAWPHR